MLKKIITEPLVHFLVIAILLFFIFEQGNSVNDNPNTITVSQARIEQIKQSFLTRWNREPLAKELDNALHRYTINEMYLREARSLNMDIGDKVIDRRLRQKIDFLIEDLVTTKEPTTTDLMQYYQKNIHKYQNLSVFTFQQVHFPSDGNKEELQQKISQQESLIAQGKAPQGELKLLPYQINKRNSKQISRIFGSRFSKELKNAPLSSWSGPIESSHGMHFVLINQRTPATNKAFEVVKSTVQTDWQYENLQLAKASFEEQLIQRYIIEKIPDSIETPQSGVSQ